MTSTKTPGVSYVMPVLNEADYLRDAVHSILDQDYVGEKEMILALGPSVEIPMWLRLNSRRKIPGSVWLRIRAGARPLD